MRAIQRYIALTACLIVSLLLLFVLPKWEKSSAQLSVKKELQSFLDHHDLETYWSERKFSPGRSCSMENCFDYSKCRNAFKVYVYPSEGQESQNDEDTVEDQQKSIYEAILTSIKESRYYTQDPKEACLFVLSIDTLDRDKLSILYVSNVQSKIRALDLWNEGTNHIIFNLYSGSWPDYIERLDFNYGKAILAKASISEDFFRQGFDVSLPLFHKEHAQKGGSNGLLRANTVPALRSLKLVFKGKRYLTGIGSETRNTLYHIHNGKDMILLTTCKHGKGWQNKMDERCEEDNIEYDKWDYKTLLINSTFCLVPRGRRLGSYRFLEALEAGCIPVLLSNGWVLPFSEVIEWKKAVVWGDERLLLQVPDIVRSISHWKILEMRQQTQFLWSTYFSSVDKIVMTTLEIIKERIDTQAATRSKWVWNVAPGALATLPDFSESLKDYPFFRRRLRLHSTKNFTAVIYVSSELSSISPLTKLVKRLSKSTHLTKILLLWNKNTAPSRLRRNFANVKANIILKVINHVNERFYPHEEIDTDAVLSLDEDALLITDEIDFAFSVWQEFPDRIVGYPARSHYWHEAREQWMYSSAQKHHFSMVLTYASFYHKYYNYLYTHSLHTPLFNIVSTAPHCTHILMNFLVSHVTKRPPIKVLQRKISTANERMQPSESWMMERSADFVDSQSCMLNITKIFGYMPLKNSQVRIDPLLYKDHVSKHRKKYKTVENITWN